MSSLLNTNNTLHNMMHIITMISTINNSLSNLSQDVNLSDLSKINLNGHTQNKTIILIKNGTNLIKNTTNSTSDSIDCELLGEFGFIIQGILGVLSFSVLVLKRVFESPQRKWKVWFFDSSKQLISSAFAHFMNVLIALFLASNHSGSDSCVWYFINIFVDTTIGVFICYLLMKLLTYFAEKNNWRVSSEYKNFFVFLVYANRIILRVLCKRR